MRRLTALTILLMTTLALAPAATADSDDAETYRYVAGSSAPTDVPEPDAGLDRGFCTHDRNGVPTGLTYLVPTAGPDALVYVGGACGLTDVGPDVEIAVEDAAAPEPVTFDWVLSRDLAHGVECESGQATGQVTVHVAAGCNEFRVMPKAGSVTGTITLAPAA